MRLVGEGADDRRDNPERLEKGFTSHFTPKVTAMATPVPRDLPHGAEIHPQQHRHDHRPPAAAALSFQAD
jgi:hypothetical protein